MSPAGSPPHKIICITASSEDGLPMGLASSLEGFTGLCEWHVWMQPTPKHLVAAKEDCVGYWFSLTPSPQREQAWLCFCCQPLLWFCSLELLTQACAFLVLLRGMLDEWVLQTVLDWSAWGRDEAEETA